MKPLDIATLPLGGTHLIEASAGTGKTHALATLYVRLVVERGLDVSRIALVTFTDAAARELSARVQDMLRQHPAPQARWALLRFDTARIGTIHRLFRRLLDEFAFDVGRAPTRAEPSDGALPRMQAVRDFWRDGALRMRADEFAAFAAWAKDLRTLDRRVAEVLRVPEAQRVPAAVSQSDIDLQLATLRQRGMALRTEPAWATTWAQLHGSDLLKRAKDLPYFPATLAAHERAIVAWLDNAQAASPSADDVAVLCPATQLEYIKQTKQAQKSPWVVPDAAIAAWAEQCREMLIERERAQRVQWLHDATRAVTAALARARRERDLLTYDELILDLHVALHGAQGARLAHSIRAVLDAALVDEFQDTDAEQYAVFRRLFIDQPNGTLILVGDPKQAIYRFRGGDVFAYRAAANDAGERRWALMQNWRSDARLIEAVNTLFDPERVPRAFRHEFIDFAPAQYAGGDKQQARADRAWSTPLRFWLADGDAASNKRDRSALAVRACVDEIATLLQQGAAPGSIAVLTRSNQQADDMVRALRTRGIAAASRGNGPVTASDIAADVLALLDALDRSEDTARQRAALATRLMGYNAEALRALERDGTAWTRAITEFEELRSAHARGGMASLMWRVYAMAAPRLLCTPDGAQHLADLRQLAVALIEAGAVAGGLAEAATWLTRMRAAEHNRDAERAAVNDDVAVQVLTMHKAKGLEWDIVFAPFLWDEVDGRDAYAPVRFHDAQGQLRVDLGSREASAHRQLHDDEADAETVRLIYVALTRARVAAYVLVFERKKPGDATFDGLLRGTATAASLAAALTALAAQAPQAIAVLPLPSAPGAVPPSAPLPEVRAHVLPHRIDRGFALLSYSALVSDGAADARDHDTYISRGDDSEDNPRGARLGECVHALLELAMQRTRAGVDAADIDAYCLRFGFRGRAREVVRQLVQRALDASLDDANGQAEGSVVRLRDVEAHTRVAELEFHFAWRAGAWDALVSALGDTPPWLERLRRAPHGLFHGYIDLVFAHAGRWYVLDYKTNDLGTAEDAYAPAAIALAVQREGYDVQALVYSLAIHRMLRQRLGDAYDYDAHYGGAWYWFLRGMTYDSAHGRYLVRPGRALIDALDRAFAWSAP